MLTYFLAKELLDLGIIPKQAYNWRGSVCSTCTNRPCGSYGYQPLPDCHDYQGEYGSGYVHDFSQLREEIERSGYSWALQDASIFGEPNFNGYRCYAESKTPIKPGELPECVEGNADTPENAMALVLIRIKKKGQKSGKGTLQE